MNKITRKELMEHKCARSCLYMVEENLSVDLDKAEQAAIDMLKSIRELKRLEVTKTNYKELEKVVQQLHSRGILVDTVKRPLERSL